MSLAPASSAKPIRLWPGVVIVAVQWLIWFVLPVVVPEALMVAFAGGAIGGLAVVVWWVFLSRARWSERLGVIAVMVVAVIATRPLLDQSIQVAVGGVFFDIYVIPGICLALVAGAAAGRRLSTGPRVAAIAAAILIACGGWTLARAEGFRVGRVQLAWRWTATAEERLLAQAAEIPAPLPAPAATAPTDVAAPDAARGLRASGSAGLKPGGYVSPAAPAWPGFRGPARDGIVRGVRIETDWSKSPPVELWRRPIGPGWSSFAVQGDLFYTQEQRGDEEMVACYRVSTGKPVWVHRDKTRFWESFGGAGPRATPALSHGRVYSFGATGILNALDAGTGAVVWSRNVGSDTKMEVPTWGFSSSPLVVDDLVIVAASGTMAGYDLATGKPRWVGPRHDENYSSPHLARIDGVAQILHLSPPSVTSVAPADGALLWEHTWDGGAIVQPALTADGDVLINSVAPTGGLGVRRLSVKRGPAPNGVGGSATWTVTERWTSNGLKPYFSDFVIHKDHAYGFDGSILASIDLGDGKRKWKGGRYGEGQLILSADQDVLLVLSEEGELALVSATPDKFTELAQIPGIEGKTWNHPVLVGDVLLIRNGEEMAAFRLKLAGR
jgi:outer membrane protein assembly factor BamB